MVLVIIAAKIESGRLDEQVRQFDSLISALDSIKEIEESLTINGYQALTIIPNLTVEKYREMSTNEFGPPINEG